MNKFIRAGMLYFLVVVAELFALSVSAMAPGLERIHAGPEGTWYINAKTMVNPANDRISFWSTIVPVKGGEYDAQMRMVLEKARKNPRRLEYVQTLQEVDCATRKIVTSNILLYDKLDRIVHTINVPRPEQQTAAVGDAADSLLVAACGQQVARLMGE